MVYHHRQFAADQVNDALDRLETIEMPRDEARKLERRLKELRVYEGFTCAIELSFVLASRISLFELRNDWFEGLSGLGDGWGVAGGRGAEGAATQGVCGDVLRGWVSPAQAMEPMQPMHWMGVFASRLQLVLPSPVRLRVGRGRGRVVPSLPFLTDLRAVQRNEVTTSP